MASVSLILMRDAAVQQLDFPEEGEPFYGGAAFGSQQKNVGPSAAARTDQIYCKPCRSPTTELIVVASVRSLTLDAPLTTARVASLGNPSVRSQ